MTRFLPLVLVLISGSCAGSESGRAPDPVAGAPGEPVPGLGPSELARFRRGAALFNKVFTPEEGLGPTFNENQCSACHTDPAPGGTGDQSVTKATRWSEAEGCDLLVGAGGGNVRTRTTPLLQAHGVQNEVIPEEATEVSRFIVPFLFGLGLAEAIPEGTLASLADPEDEDGDGISGRLARTPDGGVGLFGRKGDFASLDAFNSGAFFLEMGITTPVDPGPETLNGAPLPPGSDPAPDPEVAEEALALVTDFVRYLAPVARRLPRDPEARGQVDRGEVLFHRAGCAGCHVPVLETGPQPVEALSEKSVAFYSDFLLHDLGPEAAGVCGPDAAPTELRTGILMGVGLRDRYFHDGGAGSLEEAILRHGGEAQGARGAFHDLSELERHYLIRFLETL